MSNLQAGLHTCLLESEIDLGEIVIKLNRLIHENTNAAEFITFFIAALERTSGRLRYVRAGHDIPLLIETGGGAPRGDDMTLIVLRRN